LLSSNLDTIGHSEVCNSIQDRALEHQLFELIINLASLQPIAEDRLEAEDLSLRQAPAMLVALSSTLCARLFGCAVNSRLAPGVRIIAKADEYPEASRSDYPIQVYCSY
jgi:hypothetical protein